MRLRTGVDALHFDPGNRYIASLLEELGLLDGTRLKQLGGLTSIYAALLLTEGVGLLMKKHWAEYLTVVVTGSLIPLKIYEVIMRFGLGRLALPIINLGIVWFLIRALKRKPAASAVEVPV